MPKFTLSTSTALPTDPFAERTHRLAARRIARIVAGASMIVGVLAGVPLMLAVAWLKNRMAYGTGSVVALWFFALMIAPAILGWAVKRLVRVLPTQWFLSSADGLRVPSFVVPAVGVALVFPLGIQVLPLLCIAGLIGGDAGRSAPDFYGAIAGLGTLHVHLAYAILLGRDARRAADGEPKKNNIAVIPAALACLPGIIWLFPPFLVAGIAWALQKTFRKVAAGWLEGDRELDDAHHGMQALSVE
jgi:hypothetical protein